MGAGINTSGLPNTESYNLGRGILYFAELLDNGLPGAYRDLGNCPEFNSTVDLEELSHQSSRQGLRITDKSVVISQEINLTFNLDEINFQNLALFYSGQATTKANVLSFADYEMIPAAAGSQPGLLPAHWYVVRDSTGSRAYDIGTGNLTLTGGTSGALTEGTDYTLDSAQGRFFIPEGAGITAGESLNVTLSATGGAANVDVVDGLTSTNVIGSLQFIAENPANNDVQTVFDFWKTTLKPNGDFALIGDEYTVMPFSAVAEANSAVTSGSQSVSVTYVNPQN